MTWRPPTARNQPDDRFDNPHEGVPSWLAPPLIAWVQGFIVHYSPMDGDRYFEVELIHDMGLAVRFDPPWPEDGGEAVETITDFFRGNSNEAIDVLDFMLGRLPRYFSWQDWDLRAVELKRILDTGGSVWDVTTSEEGERGARYQLTRRVAGPVLDAIAEAGSRSERAGEHLREAWKQLLGVHPDPSAAYQSAVAAVEVAAKPVISPNNHGATLGTMRGQLRADVRDNPRMWTFELGGDPQIVVDMMGTLWESQLRHGNETAALTETEGQADAAVHLAVTLVRWFLTGAIRRT